MIFENEQPQPELSTPTDKLEIGQELNPDDAEAVSQRLLGRLASLQGEQQDQYARLLVGNGTEVIHILHYAHGMDFPVEHFSSDKMHQARESSRQLDFRPSAVWCWGTVQSMVEQHGGISVDEDIVALINDSLQDPEVPANS